MASLSFPPLLPPVVPALQVEAIAAAAPVALLQAETESLPLPAARTAPPRPDAADAAEGAAMRPDQLIMARQLTWPTPDGGALASAWRGMVRNYGDQVATRELQARAGQLPSALLQAGLPGEQQRAMLRDPQATPFDAWRFTVHAGNARDQHLRVVEGEPDEEQARRQHGRRRARAGLRLELVLEDGTVVTVQAEPVADGVALELCAPCAHALACLRELQPQLDAALRRAGLRVLGWTWRDGLPDGPAHARLPSSEAAAALSLPVFRAMAELALLLPAARARASTRA